MSIALDLARQAQGKTRPNPPVGAVLVKDSRIVGKGFTQPAGQPHAEIVALHEAGNKAIEAELYTSLEPCSHWGRTPPCSEALVRAGIMRAHVALLDPNPQVRGRGVRRLRDASIHVIVGECADEAAQLVEAHATYTTKGRPFFIVLDASAPADVAQQLKSRSDVTLGEQSSDQPLRELLEQLRVEEATSCLILNNVELSNRLLEDNLVDKIVTSIKGLIPPGFVARKQVERPSPHLLLYPAESNPHSTDSDKSRYPTERNT